jgi:uncharacterized protein
LIDVSRLAVYSKQIIGYADQFNYILIAAATLSAFIGAYTGNRLVKKITIKTLQYIVGVMLFVFSILLIMGII